jgi:methylmalonyl-CoA mutase
MSKHPPDGIVGLDAWIAAAGRSLGRDVRTLGWQAADDILVKPLYTAQDLHGLPHVDSLPGFEPYVRGPQATMYTGRPWTIRQYAGFSTAEDSNQHYRDALAAGAQGLSVAFDLPTHRGYDSDNPRVAGDVGKTGVAVDTVEDMKILFRDIPLDQVSVSMTMNGAVLPVFAAYIVAAEEQDVAVAQLAGTIQNDILKEFMVRNTYIYPPAPSMRIVGDVVAYCAAHMPRFNPISISGYHMQEAGANEPLELAFTLANGREYVRTAMARGLEIDAFAGRLSFFWAIGMNFYVEIAKLRAARMLWSKLMVDLGARNPRSLMLRAHCQTSGWSLTAQEPHNNIVRTTVEAMAAVFGGTQSLHTNALDEVLALPTEFSARVARNTQHILQEETHITAVIDPWAGSYMMESLTHDMAASVTRIMDEIESQGGMTHAVESGWAKSRIEACAASKQARIDAGVDVIVGVNKYRTDTQEQFETRVVDNIAVRAAQIDRLAMVKRTRNSAAVARALAALTQAARNDSANLLALSVDAMRARATVGEVSDALEQVWGRYQAKTTRVTGVYERSFERTQEWLQLKQEIDCFAADAGRRPRILMAKLGQDGHDRGFKIIASAFADLGFDVDIGPLFQTPEECVRQATDNDVHAIGVSTLAGGHMTLVPAIVQGLAVCKAEDIIVFLGGIIPEKDHAALIAAGVAGIFGPGTPVVESARGVLAGIRAAQTARAK